MIGTLLLFHKELIVGKRIGQILGNDIEDILFS